MLAQRNTIYSDGINYLILAQAYAEKGWSAGINGFWSPLYSWLLIPILVFPPFRDHDCICSSPILREIDAELSKPPSQRTKLRDLAAIRRAPAVEPRHKPIPQEETEEEYAVLHTPETQRHLVET
jgi:hypothetical protein